METTIKAFIYEAIELEKAELKIEYKKASEFNIHNELIEIFKENTSLQNAFNALTLSKQKGYYLFFSGAKQSKTITERIEKYNPQIVNGKGFNDCTFGLSKKMPRCDGFHKFQKSIDCNQSHFECLRCLQRNV